MATPKKIPRTMVLLRDQVLTRIMNLAPGANLASLVEACLILVARSLEKEGGAPETLEECAERVGGKLKRSIKGDRL